MIKSLTRCKVFLLLSYTTQQLNCANRQHKKQLNELLFRISKFRTCKNCLRLKVFFEKRFPRFQNFSFVIQQCSWAHDKLSILFWAAGFYFCHFLFLKKRATKKLLKSVRNSGASLHKFVNSMAPPNLVEASHSPKSFGKVPKRIP